MGIFLLLPVKQNRMMKHSDEAENRNMTPKAGPWSDEIIEIEPEGKNGGKIVWEWHL